MRIDPAEEVVKKKELDEQNKLKIQKVTRIVALVVAFISTFFSSLKYYFYSERPHSTIRIYRTPFKKGRGFLWNLKRRFLMEKLYNPIGVGLLLLLAGIIAIGIAKFGLVFGALVLGMAVVLPSVYCIVAYPRFGIIVLIVVAYLLFYLGRLGIEGPMGVVADAIRALLILGTLWRLRRNHDWEILKGPVSIIILIWIGYNILQIGNPSAVSRLAWVYTIRSVAIVMFSYFVFVYNIRSIKYVRLIFKVWLGLSLYAALYGIKQEYIGFSAVEDAYLHSDPEIAGLLFIAGHWRKFSIFSDPVAFAYNMSMAATFCIALMAGKFPGWKK
ncbi:hypothetical protein HK413_02615 [Mucilaginibacter sp. S1162]|uniref:Uncharacterized protein n=1 Tax=Mucilaginibacter humi TaxID=2732510 RepID=A0ABX1VZG0_9SPHI|nr:hypothetical protein [Mucilaginibacter humi]NNU33328.1 hypothetical protein [Mucilaginibacter humi]